MKGEAEEMWMPCEERYLEITLTQRPEKGLWLAQSLRSSSALALILRDPSPFCVTSVALVGFLSFNSHCTLATTEL